MDIHNYIRNFLKVMVEKGASDIYLTADLCPMYRIEGITQPMWGLIPDPIGKEKLTKQGLEKLTQSIMDKKQRKQFAETKEMNLSWHYPDLGRFRINIFQQRGNPGMVIREIKVKIRTIDELGLHPILKDIVMSNRGLVLVVGATGSGKSASLAAMIDHRNSTSPGHIISIEDPVEYIHPHKKCVVTQREVGYDTESFQSALKNTLRQAPDVILIGEIRDRETMASAITFSDTGHLCLGTLHSNNANQAIERIMNFFEEERHQEIYLQLSLNLRSIVSQRLIKAVDGKRVVACEILLDTPRIKSLIKKGEVDVIKEAMEQGEQEGCQTFDMAILDLYTAGHISLDQALSNADSANNLRLKIQSAAMRRGVSKKEKKRSDLRIRRDTFR